MSDAQRIDRVIARYQGVKAKRELLEEEERRLKEKELVPLARKHGFKKKEALLLLGQHNSALITREADVVIIDQGRAAMLSAPWRRLYLVQFFKPSEQLKLVARNGGKNATRVLKIFLRRAVRVKRRWRVARVKIKEK